MPLLHSLNATYVNALLLAEAEEQLALAETATLCAPDDFLAALGEVDGSAQSYRQGIAFKKQHIDYSVLNKRGAEAPESPPKPAAKSRISIFAHEPLTPPSGGPHHTWSASPAKSSRRSGSSSFAAIASPAAPPPASAPTGSPGGAEDAVAPEPELTAAGASRSATRLTPRTRVRHALELKRLKLKSALESKREGQEAVLAANRIKQQEHMTLLKMQASARGPHRPEAPLLLLALPRAGAAHIAGDGGQSGIRHAAASSSGSTGGEAAAGQSGSAAGEAAEEPAELIERLAHALARSHARVLDLFRQWDASGDGKIDRTEFRRVARALGCAASSEICDALFATFDEDGSGTVEYDEVWRLLRQRNAEIFEQRPQLRPGAAGAIAASTGRAKVKSLKLKRAAGGGQQSQRSARGGAHGGGPSAGAACSSARTRGDGGAANGRDDTAGATGGATGEAPGGATGGATSARADGASARGRRRSGSHAAQMGSSRGGRKSSGVAVNAGRPSTGTGTGPARKGRSSGQSPGLPPSCDLRVHHIGLGAHGRERNLTFRGDGGDGEGSASTCRSSGGGSSSSQRDEARHGEDTHERVEGSSAASTSSTECDGRGVGGTARGCGMEVVAEEEEGEEEEAGNDGGELQRDQEQPSSPWKLFWQ